MTPIFNWLAFDISTRRARKEKAVHSLFVGALGVPVAEVMPQPKSYRVEVELPGAANPLLWYATVEEAKTAAEKIVTDWFEKAARP